MGLVVRSQLARLARKHLEARGISMRALRAEREDDLWDIDELHAFLDACAARAGNPWLGLDLVAERPVGSHGIAEFLWRSAATVREGLETLAAHARLLNDVTRLELAEDGRVATFLQHVPHPRGMGRHGNAFFVALLVRELRVLVSGDFAPAGVRLASPEARGDRARLRHALGTDALRFDDAATGLELDARWLDRRIVTADKALLDTLRAHAEAWLPWVASGGDRSLMTRLAGVLRGSKRVPTLEDAARKLGVSARTLQRRVADEGRSFQAVRDAVLAERARQRLASGEPIKAVASAMGYASSAAFARAFRRWTGATPTLWRAARSS